MAVQRYDHQSVQDLHVSCSPVLMAQINGQSSPARCDTYDSDRKALPMTMQLRCSSQREAVSARLRRIRT